MEFSPIEVSLLMPQLNSLFSTSFEIEIPMQQDKIALIQNKGKNAYVPDLILIYPFTNIKAAANALVINNFQLFKFNIS